eukprot:3489587-Pleurochrysis_carterae.AAC.2
MRSKSEAPAYVRKFLASFAAILNKCQSEPKYLVGTLHTENAGEFLSTRFADFLSGTGVHSSACPPYVHELNGVTERAIRSVMELARSNLVAASAPTCFWDFAVLHAVDILNRTSTPPGGDKSSYEMVTGDKPSIMGIMPFGCKTFAVKPKATLSKTRMESRMGWRNPGPQR